MVWWIIHPLELDSQEGYKSFGFVILTTLKYTAFINVF